MLISQILRTKRSDVVVISPEDTLRTAIASMVRDRHTSPVVFVDDMAHNLASVSDHLPDCLLLSLAPPSAVHAMAPKPPEAARVVRDWAEATPIISTLFAGAIGA